MSDLSGKQIAIEYLKNELRKLMNSSDQTLDVNEEVITKLASGEDPELIKEAIASLHYSKEKARVMRAFLCVVSYITDTDDGYDPAKDMK